MISARLLRWKNIGMSKLLQRILTCKKVSRIDYSSRFVLLEMMMTLSIRSFAVFSLVLQLLVSSVAFAMEEKKWDPGDGKRQVGQRAPYALIPQAESKIEGIKRALQRDGQIKLTDFFQCTEYDSVGYNAFIHLFGEAVKRSEIGALVLEKGFASYFSNRSHILAEVLGKITSLHTLEIIDDVTFFPCGRYFETDYDEYLREGKGDGGRRAMGEQERHFGGLWLREFINALGQNQNLRRFRVVGVPCEAHLKDLLANFRGQLPFILDLREKFHTRQEKNESSAWYWEDYDAMIASMFHEESPLFKRFGNKVELYKVCNERGDLAQVIYRPSEPLRRERKKRIPTQVAMPLSEVDALSATHHTLFDIKSLIEKMGGRVVVTTRKKKKLLKIDVTLQGHSQTFYQQGDKRMRKKQLKDFLQRF